MSKTREQLENWIEDIQVGDNDKVLDIGGSQLPVNKRIRFSDTAVFKILDLEKPHHCVKEPDIICDLNKGFFQEGTDPNLLTGYDVAFCLEVTEYLYDPIVALETIASMLKSEGVLYISFHFIYPVHNPKEFDYLRYTPIGAKKILEKTGFEVVEITPRLGEWNPMMDGMKPSRDYNSHDWVGCLIKAKKL